MLTFILAFIVFLQKKLSLKRAVINAGIILALTLLVLVPNGIRNKKKFGEFRFLYIFSGGALWYGNNPAVTLSGILPGEYIALPIPEEFPVGSFDRESLRRDFSDWYTETDDPELGPSATLDAGELTPVQLDDLYRHYAIQYIKTHKLKTWSLIAIRFWNLFKTEDHGLSAVRLGLPPDAGSAQWKTFRFFEIITPNYYRAVVLLMLGYLVVCLREPKKFAWSRRFIPVLIIVFNMIPFLMITAVCRYHFHLIPLFVVYAAAAIDSIVAAFRTRIFAS
jgi:hypothetical protein